MAHKIDIASLKEATYVPNFTNFEIVKRNTENRCSAYMYGVKGKEDMENALREGYSLTEIEKSSAIIKNIIKSLRTVGYISISTIPALKRFENGKVVLYLLDGHHLFRAVLEMMYETGKRIPINILVFPETKTRTLKKVSNEMCELNKGGAVRWEFLDIVRSYKTKTAKTFVELFCKYGQKVNTFSVVANAVLNMDGASSRSETSANWGVESNNVVWPYAKDFLESISHLDINKKISQDFSNAYRQLFNLAIDCNCLGLFKAFFASTKLEINFTKKGRTNKAQWLEKLVSIMIGKQHFSAYGLASKQDRAKYRKFLNKANSLIDWKSIYAKAI